MTKGKKMEKTDVVKRGSQSKQYDCAKEYALKLLSYRPRSSGELRERLEGKGFSCNVSSQIVKRFKFLRLLDDQQFALDVIRNVRERKPCSKYAVVIKLKNMRIEDSVIQSAVEDWTYETDQEMASKVLLKDLGPSNSNPNLEPRRIKRAIMKLRRRGFPYSVIKTVLAERGLNQLYSDHG